MGHVLLVIAYWAILAAFAALVLVGVILLLAATPGCGHYDQKGPKP